MGNIKKRQRLEKRRETSHERLSVRIKITRIITCELHGVGRLPAVLSAIFALPIYFGILWYAFCAVSGVA
jgi:hypothetical protein